MTYGGIAKCPLCGRTDGSHVLGCLWPTTTVLPLPREQTLEGMIEAKDAEIARLNALLAEAREGLRSYHGVLKLLRTNLEFIAQGGNTANELIRTYERRAREVCCSMDAELDALAKLGA